MNTDRKNRLITQIKERVPGITNISTCWDSCDFDVSGIQIKATHASTGNVLCASRRDDELDAMTEESVIAWADSCWMDFVRRQGRTRAAIRTEREMGR